ncbi:MAG: hypothetical protein AAFR14_10065, partial [Bacteroidota bacterium]
MRRSDFVKMLGYAGGLCMVVTACEPVEIQQPEQPVDLSSRERYLNDLAADSTLDLSQLEFLPIRQL